MVTTGRDARIAERSRHPRWQLSPLRVDRSACVNCDLCLRACPPEFGAVVQGRFSVAIVPELCSGCGRCVAPCPVDCIVEDPRWTPAPADVWAGVRIDVRMEDVPA